MNFKKCDIQPCITLLCMKVPSKTFEFKVNVAAIWWYFAERLMFSPSFEFNFVPAMCQTD